MQKDDELVGEARTHEGSEMSEDEIDENLQDTFPASDPPSWTLGTNHQGPPEGESNEEEPPPH